MPLQQETRKLQQELKEMAAGLNNYAVISLDEADTLALSSAKALAKLQSQVAKNPDPELKSILAELETIYQITRKF